MYQLWFRRESGAARGAWQMFDFYADAKAADKGIRSLPWVCEWRLVKVTPVRHYYHFKEK